MKVRRDPPRYAPGRPFPPYAFVPGRDPHPTRDPRGHSFGEGSVPGAYFPAERWRENEDYLFALDLYNHGYFWESHECLEPLWQAAKHDHHQALHLQGLIQCAAACLKIRMDQPEGLEALARLGTDKLESVAREAGADYMGLDLSAFVEAMRAFAASKPASAEKMPLVVVRSRQRERDPESRTVLVANGQGFWGDSILGPVRLVREGPLDYLTLDYLAEVTMSILQKLRARDPEAGYATDFVRLIDRILPEILERDVRVVANAGGVNPHACKDALMRVIARHGVSGVKVAVVEGDDVLDRLDELLATGEELRNMDTGEPLSTVRDRVTSANVYLGAFPIAEALDQGARIVLTGRGTDPGLVLGPLIHEFGWEPRDTSLLAAGTVAGHIVECGAQCTGGNFTDWRAVEDLARIGYPIVEARPNGTFVVTKHGETGGMVTEDTVRHQLVYEMGDPQGYITPDCVADFTSFKLRDLGGDRVEVSGVTGRPATDTYKVSISYRDGWKSVGQLTISGPDALEKARLCARIVWERLAMDGFEYAPRERLEEYVGAGVCHAGIDGGETEDPPEVVLRMGVKGPDRDRVDRFGMELVPLVTSGPPGVTGFAGGRPKATEIIGFWPALVKKSLVQTQVSVYTA